MKKSGVIFTVKEKHRVMGFVSLFCIILSVLLFSFHKSALVSSQSVIAASPNSQNSVSIQNMQFSPPQISISVGTTVMWTNNEVNIPHTVTSDTGVWDSGTLQPGQSFSRIFSTPGTFTYHCNIHPFMHGTIVVTRASSSPTPSPQITQMPSSSPTPTLMSTPSATPVSTVILRPTPTIPVTPTPITMSASTSQTNMACSNITQNGINTNTNCQIIQQQQNNTQGSTQVVNQTQTQNQSVTPRQ